MAERLYSDDEVQEILRVAIEREQGDRAGLAREEIAAAATEIGIDPDSIDRAIFQLESQREIDAEVAALRAARRRALRSHLSTWAIVNTLLFAIDWIGGGGFWFYWPLLGWGIGVALQARAVFFADPKKERARAERRLARRERKQARHSRRLRRKHAETKLEAAIEQGVADVLTAAANRVAASLEGNPRPRQRVEPPPRTRVAGDEYDEAEADEAASEREAAPQRRRRD